MRSEYVFCYLNLLKCFNSAVSDYRVFLVHAVIKAKRFNKKYLDHQKYYIFFIKNFKQFDDDNRICISVLNKIRMQNVFSSFLLS